MPALRLFVALELPERVRRDLNEAVEPWRERLSAARWGPPENWHTTLLFLGATEDDRIGWIEERLAEVTRVTSPCETTLTEFGGFPSASRAKVIWAGLADPHGRIARLARSVADALETELEREPFLPHVTVARAQRPIRLPKEFTAQRLRTRSFEVTDVVLFRSHLGNGPPRYEALAHLPLGEDSA